MIKQIDGLSIDNLIQMCKSTFSEQRLPSKIVSDAGTNVISEMFRNFMPCHHLTIINAMDKQNHTKSLLKELQIVQNITFGVK